jgi:WhiB family redox-sensing transcriptional regulator
MPPRSDWQTDAACVGTDPELFFPPSGSKGLDAKAVCQGCPVSAECLDYALADPHLVGVWGGTSDLQRKQHHQLRKVLA